MGHSLPVQPAPVVLGADGCRGGGWAVAVLDGTGALSWREAADTSALLGLADALHAAAVALDVPIGLPAAGGRRVCDDLARSRLGARRSAVFAAPPRQVLGCASYRAARSLAPSLSAQAFALVPRIRQVDRALRDWRADVHDVVVECHPEVGFARLAAGRLELPQKKTAAGALTRLALLEQALRQDLPVDVPPGAALDDALDAAACAVTARRWAGGTAQVLGGEVDATGVPMRIVV